MEKVRPPKMQEKEEILKDMNREWIEKYQK